MNSTQPARVRFAPSPTGRFHIGGARTALYDYLLAQQTQGQFILRIEDTDRKRFVPEAEQEIMDGLRWLGLEWDEGPDKDGEFGPYRQSEREGIYLDHANQLVDLGHAYFCFCSPERLSRVRQEQQKKKLPPRYDRTCRKIDPAVAAERRASGESSVVRFKTPTSGTTIAIDHLRGEINVENENLDDFILLKSNGLPVYHLAAMVDDHLMEITHVFRGSEWLPTFPLHVMLYQAFGWDQPIWVHLSVFLNPSGKGKLSKRQSEGSKGAQAVFVQDLAELGYMPEAVNNWIALMGWSYDDHTEDFSLPDLIERFSIDKLNPSPAAVNFSKLDHFNGVYIRGLSLDEFVSRIAPYYVLQGLQAPNEILVQVAPLIQDRIKTLDEAPLISRFFFQDEVDPDVNELIGKNMGLTETIRALERSAQVLDGASEFTPASLEQPMRDLADELELKAGQLFGILRIAVTGQRVSPPLFETMVIVGKQTVMDRIAASIELLNEAEPTTN